MSSDGCGGNLSCGGCASGQACSGALCVDENIPVDKLITASREACSSPCPVFFDAIAGLSWEEIEASTFTWAFSDGTSSDGYMAAHVFELPQDSVAEETFEVALVVERDGVLVARDAQGAPSASQKATSRVARALAPPITSPVSERPGMRSEPTIASCSSGGIRFRLGSNSTLRSPDPYR
jgi:hypothetical protein